MENTGFISLAPWLVFFPVIGLLINLIFGGRMSEKAIGWTASIASGATFVVSVLLAYSVSAAHGEALTTPPIPWMHVGDLVIDWTFRAD